MLNFVFFFQIFSISFEMARSRLFKVQNVANIDKTVESGKLYRKMIWKTHNEFYEKLFGPHDLPPLETLGFFSVCNVHISKSDKTTKSTSTSAHVLLIKKKTRAFWTRSRCVRSSHARDTLFLNNQLRERARVRPRLWVVLMYMVL